MVKPAEIFEANIPRPLGELREAQAFAPSNIALSKYWGKRDAGLNLPLNSSLSISLGSWGTETTIRPSEQDTLIFNGTKMASDTAAAAKIWRFVDLFCGVGRPALAIETSNNIPTAAGLASSASGFAALTLALNAAFACNLSKPTMSMLARFGSGSATRSFWQGFVRWDAGDAPDGSDSFATPLEVDFPSFRIAILTVDSGPKSHSSTDGMTHTVRSSPLFENWPDKANADCAEIERHIRNGNFVAIGELAEANALAMHATMMAARPAVCYLKPETWSILQDLWRARQDGLVAYATMDAGPNVKLVFEESTASDVLNVFPNAQMINPFEGSSV